MQIQSVLNELSSKELLTGTDEDQELASGDEYLDYPTGYKRLISIALNDGTNDGPPLEALSRGWIEYLELMEGAVSTGEPEFFTEVRNSGYGMKGYGGPESTPSM